MRFDNVVGVECRRFDGGVEEREVLRINGVRPDDLPSEPGSENRTRFFDLFGVSGGVEIPRPTPRDVEI